MGATNQSPRPARAKLLEPLEHRSHLAADFTAAVSTFTFPTGVSAGTPSAGEVTVVVTNRGPTRVPNSAGNILTAVKLRPAGTRGAHDILLAEVPLSVAGLAANGAKSLHVPVRTPARLAGGNYSVVAIADSAKELPETNEKNNAGVSRTPLSVRDVHPDLAVATATTTLGHATPTKPTGTATLRNAGDVPLHGSVDVEFVVAPVGGQVPPGSLKEGFIIGSRTGVRIDLAPGQTAIVARVRLSMPSNQTTRDVQYHVWARIIPHTRPVDLQQSNNSRAAGRVTVPGDPLLNPLTAAGLGTRLTFTATGSTPPSGMAGRIETGTVTDNAGHAGTYSAMFGGMSPALHLTFTQPTYDTGYSFRPADSVQTLDGLTVELMVDYFDRGELVAVLGKSFYWELRKV